MKSQNPPEGNPGTPNASPVEQIGTGNGPDLKNADPRLVHPAGLSGNSPDPRMNAKTNPDVVRPELDNMDGGLIGASSLVKKGPANVIEEEKERRALANKPKGQRLTGDAAASAPKQQYKVLHGSVRHGNDEHAYDVNSGEVLELSDQDAAHLLAAGAIEKFDGSKSSKG